MTIVWYGMLFCFGMAIGAIYNWIEDLIQSRKDSRKW